MMSKIEKEGGGPEIRTLLNKGHYIRFGQGGREGFKNAQKIQTSFMDVPLLYLTRHYLSQKLQRLCLFSGFWHIRVHD